jgi:hypothetical protein
MKHSMKQLIVLAVVVGIGVAAGAAGAAERTYTEEAGDSGTAPDLTPVTVTEGSGLVVFEIAATLASSTSFEITIDRDRNRATGDEGAEVWVAVFQEADGKSYWDADVWNGSRWEDEKLDVISRTFPGREEIGFRAADAGLTGSFDFKVYSVKMVADAVESVDRAPDSIVPWTYELSTVTTTAAKATLGQVRLTPARPVAGSRLTVRVAATRSDTKQALTSGVAKCSATVKGRTVRGTASVAAGFATCKLGIPKGSSGTLGRGSITVGTGAQAVSKTFSFRIA